jgi:signal transduction histidine kinase
MAAGMAHEIRNPLGGIQLYASMLTKDLVDCPASLQWAQKISGGVKHLESLVSSVLQFTREIAPHIAPAELSQLVGTTVELAEAQAQAAGVAVKVDGAAPLSVRVDGNLLSQALLNLLLNAIQATPSGGSVSVRFCAAPAAKSRRQFCLAVRDGGPGIDPRILERIFNPFFTTKETGTGLGLSIVHRIVDAHEGTITASNLAGGGAMFEMEI